jgi:phenylacetate-CoA ligase
LYGSEEFNRLAWECEKQQGYHLDIDLHYIEFIDKNNNIVKTGDGEFVVTSLVNYGFPYIRYKLGDFAKLTKKKCSCKRSFPIVEQIQGREDDYIKLPSGRIISPRRINIIEEIPGIQHYQTIQRKKNLFEVLVVKDNKFSKNTINQIKHQIKLGSYGEDVQVNVKLVDKIKREKSGKLRAVISLVK